MRSWKKVSPTGPQHRPSSQIAFPLPLLLLDHVPASARSPPQSPLAGFAHALYPPRRQRLRRWKHRSAPRSCGQRFPPEASGRRLRAGREGRRRPWRGRRALSRWTRRLPAGWQRQGARRKGAAPPGKALRRPPGVAMGGRSDRVPVCCVPTPFSSLWLGVHPLPSVPLPGALPRPPFVPRRTQCRPPPQASGSSPRQWRRPPLNEGGGRERNLLLRLP